MSEEAESRLKRALEILLAFLAIPLLPEPGWNQRTLFGKLGYIVSIPVRILGSVVFLFSFLILLLFLSLSEANSHLESAYEKIAFKEADDE